MMESLFTWLVELVDFYLSHGSGEYLEMKLDDVDIKMCERLKKVLDLMTINPRCEEVDEKGV